MCLNLRVSVLCILSSPLISVIIYLVKVYISQLLVSMGFLKNLGLFLHSLRDADDSGKELVLDFA